MNWYLSVLKNYVGFSGRARRTEYWMFILINLIIGFVIGLVEGVFGSPGILGMLYTLVVFLPSLAVTVRRLHDTDRSGWWVLLALIPFLGTIVLIIFLVLDGTPGPNRYGPSPKVG